jgi:hypothetical protein
MADQLEDRRGSRSSYDPDLPNLRPWELEPALFVPLSRAGEVSAGNVHRRRQTEDDDPSGGQVQVRKVEAPRELDHRS